jgi:hypothetical protein
MNSSLGFMKTAAIVCVQTFSNADRLWDLRRQAMRNALRVLTITSVCAGLMTPAARAESKHVSATGWFADDKCAMARAKSGTFASTNPECALRCVKNGAKLVFIAEQQKAIWPVAQPDGYVVHIGEYVEISGILDDASGAMRIESLETIDKVRPSCKIPRRKQH